MRRRGWECCCWLCHCVWAFRWPRGRHCSRVVGAGSLVLLLLWDAARVRRQAWSRLVPGALVAVVSAVALNQALRTLAPAWQVRPEHLVHLPVLSSLGQVAREMTWPDFEG